MPDDSLTLHLVYEHRDFIIVHKPPGMPMHDSESGIITQAKRQLNKSTLYLCHRLDTVTSGCVILATSSTAAAAIGALFSTRQIQKYYLALLSGKPKKKQGTISGDMKNRRRGQHVLLKSQDNPAVTQFFSFALAPGVRAAIVKPLTGKTHQIRVAMKSLGSPIMGDSQYGGQASDRTYLHAFGLNFEYEGDTITAWAMPIAGEYFTCAAFSQWLGSLGNPAVLAWPSYTLPKQCKDTDDD